MSLYTRSDVAAEVSRIAHEAEATAESRDWLSQFEDFTCAFLDLIFHRSLSTHHQTREYKALSATEMHELEGSSQDQNDLFNKLSNVVDHLEADILSQSLPLMANLVFLKRQNFSQLDNLNTLEMISKFRKSKEEHANLDSNTRLKKLVDFVENIRKYSEFLLRSTDLEVLQDKSSINYSNDAPPRDPSAAEQKSMLHLPNSDKPSRNKFATSSFVSPFEVGISAGRNFPPPGVTTGAQLRPQSLQLPDCTANADEYFTTTVIRRMCQYKFPKPPDIEPCDKIVIPQLLPCPRPKIIKKCVLPKSKEKPTCATLKPIPKQLNMERCPLLVLGLGVSGMVPSLTDISLRRELNIPGSKPFQTPCQPLHPCFENKRQNQCVQIKKCQHQTNCNTKISNCPEQQILKNNCSPDCTGVTPASNYPVVTRVRDQCCSTTNLGENVNVQQNQFGATQQLHPQLLCSPFHQFQRQQQSGYTSQLQPQQQLEYTTQPQRQQQSDYTTQPQRQQQSDYTTQPQRQQQSDYTTQPQRQQQSGYTTQLHTKQQLDYTTQPQRQQQSGYTTQLQTQQQLDYTTQPQRQQQSDYTTQPQRLQQSGYTTQPQRQQQYATSNQERKQQTYRNNYSSQQTRNPQNISTINAYQHTYAKTVQPNHQIKVNLQSNYTKTKALTKKQLKKPRQSNSKECNTLNCLSTQTKKKKLFNYHSFPTQTLESPQQSSCQTDITACPQDTSCQTGLRKDSSVHLSSKTSITIIRKNAEDNELHNDSSVHLPSKAPITVIRKNAEDDDNELRNDSSVHPSSKAPITVIRKNAEDDDNELRNDSSVHPSSKAPITVIRKNAEDNELRNDSSVHLSSKAPITVIRKNAEDNELRNDSSIHPSSKAPITVIRKNTEDDDLEPKPKSFIDVGTSRLPEAKVEYSRDQSYPRSHPDSNGSGHSKIYTKENDSNSHISISISHESLVETNSDRTDISMESLIQVVIVDSSNQSMTKIPSPEFEIPARVSPLSESSKIPIPESESSEILSPETESSEVLSPESESTDILSPGSESTEILSSAVESSEILSPEFHSSKIQPPKIDSSKVQHPKIESSEILSPQTESSEILSPEISSDEINSSKILSHNRIKSPITKNPLEGRINRSHIAENESSSNKPFEDRSSPSLHHLSSTPELSLNNIKATIEGIFPEEKLKMQDQQTQFQGTKETNGDKSLKSKSASRKRVDKPNAKLRRCHESPPECAVHNLDYLPPYHPFRRPYPPQYIFNPKRLSEFMNSCNNNSDNHNNGMNYGRNMVQNQENQCPYNNVNYLNNPTPVQVYPMMAETSNRQGNCFRPFLRDMKRIVKRHNKKKDDKICQNTVDSNTNGDAVFINVIKVIRNQQTRALVIPDAIKVSATPSFNHHQSDSSLSHIVLVDNIDEFSRLAKADAHLSTHHPFGSTVTGTEENTSGTSRDIIKSYAEGSAGLINNLSSRKDKNNDAENQESKNSHTLLVNTSNFSTKVHYPGSRNETQGSQIQEQNIKFQFQNSLQMNGEQRNSMQQQLPQNPHSIIQVQDTQMQQDNFHNSWQINGGQSNQMQSAVSNGPPRRIQGQIIQMQQQNFHSVAQNPPSNVAQNCYIREQNLQGSSQGNRTFNTNCIQNEQAYSEQPEMLTCPIDISEWYRNEQGKGTTPQNIKEYLNQPDVRMIQEQKTSIVRRPLGGEGPSKVITQVETYYSKAKDGAIEVLFKSPVATNPGSTCHVDMPPPVKAGKNRKPCAEPQPNTQEKPFINITQDQLNLIDNLFNPKTCRVETKRKRKKIRNNQPCSFPPMSYMSQPPQPCQLPAGSAATERWDNPFALHPVKIKHPCQQIQSGQYNYMQAMNSGNPNAIMGFQNGMSFQQPCEYQQIYNPNQFQFGQQTMYANQNAAAQPPYQTGQLSERQNSMPHEFQPEPQRDTSQLSQHFTMNNSNNQGQSGTDPNQGYSFHNRNDQLSGQQHQQEPGGIGNINDLVQSAWNAPETGSSNDRQFPQNEFCSAPGTNLTQNGSSNSPQFSANPNSLGSQTFLRNSQFYSFNAIKSSQHSVSPGSQMYDSLHQNGSSNVQQFSHSHTNPTGQVPNHGMQPNGSSNIQQSYQNSATPGLQFYTSMSQNDSSNSPQFFQNKNSSGTAPNPCLPQNGSTSYQQSSKNSISQGSHMHASLPQNQSPNVPQFSQYNSSGQVPNPGHQQNGTLNIQQSFQHSVSPGSQIHPFIHQYGQSNTLQFSQHPVSGQLQSGSSWCPPNTLQSSNMRQPGIDNQISSQFYKQQPYSSEINQYTTTTPGANGPNMQSLPQQIPGSIYYARNLSGCPPHQMPSAKANKPCNPNPECYVDTLAVPVRVSVPCSDQQQKESNHH